MDINRIIIYIMLFFVLVGGFSALVIALFLSGRRKSHRNNAEVLCVYFVYNGFIRKAAQIWID